jgi:pyruvate ferredoxin oxidoreductase beta subunit
MKDLPSTHLLGTGTPMCSGCGGLEALHQIYDVLGENTVFVNAAGCMTLLSAYPFTPFRGSWLYTAMASAPAGAQGIRDALDILIEQGRLPATEDLQVVVLTGDGATTTRATATPGSSIPVPHPTGRSPPPAGAAAATPAIRRTCSRYGPPTGPAMWPR